jgi:hypothetical protein
MALVVCGMCGEEAWAPPRSGSRCCMFEGGCKEIWIRLRAGAEHCVTPALTLGTVHRPAFACLSPRQCNIRYVCTLAYYHSSVGPAAPGMYDARACSSHWLWTLVARVDANMPPPRLEVPVDAQTFLAGRGQRRRALPATALASNSSKDSYRSDYLDACVRG